MYCPRCGYQTTSDELRFCSYCGFKLGVVKAALADGEEVPPAVLSATQTLIPQPRQRDMNVGVFLMFAATLLASFMTTLPGLSFSRATGAALLTIFYFAILMLSGQITKAVHKLLSWEESEAELASSQRGLCSGATLMFISTVLVAIASLLTFGRLKTTPFFVGLGFAFAFCLLLSQFLMRGLLYLVQGETKVALPRNTANQPLASVVEAPSLPAAKPAAVSLFGTQKVQTAEIVAPSSITEHTTNLLDNR